ncbi:MAG: sigma-70 family RNA polymerase sigma factor [Pseudomonadota bacterium]
MQLTNEHYALARKVAMQTYRRWRPTWWSREDWEQDALLALVRAAASYDPARGAVLPHLAVRVRHLLCDHMRNHGPYSRLHWQEVRAGLAPAVEVRQLGGGSWTLPSPKADQDARLEAADVLALLERLAGARNREIVERHLLRDQTQAAIGLALGISESRVSQILRALLRRLREELRARGCG